MKAKRTLAVMALFALGTAGLVACGNDSAGTDGDATATGTTQPDTGDTSDDTSGDTSGSDVSSDEQVTLTIWHVQTSEAGVAFFEETAALYTAEHPNVTFNIQPIQNEDLDGKLQTALNSGDAPDVFSQRGGGKMRDMVDAGQLLDLTDLITDTTKEQLGEGIFEAIAYQGKVWNMPESIQPGGIWYSKDLFEQAGITETPTTLEELNAVIEKLKAAGITPIALGGMDAWPAAHWFYFFALRECPGGVIDAVADNPTLEDACWLKAAEDLETFAAQDPFNEGFLTTPAQQGAGSSAGQIANHMAAMELMGSWNAGTIASLTPDGQPLADLGWFPFPQIPGGQGDPTAVMGGSGGMSCSAQAPAEICADFLNFYVSPERQIAYYEAIGNPPLNQEAASAVTEPYVLQIMDAIGAATYSTDWLDTTLGQNIGNALNTAVTEMLAGQIDAAGMIEEANMAAAKG
ncbi:MAG: extracellular solute-binding protein [Bifidobacteriaceae bacterium]|jgi:raffinose/stachyose/melibiose transport system substrate-binding protein|nr:extracellular solute-binding protein [Bifidobacteriaceae bacterium]